MSCRCERTGRPERGLVSCDSAFCNEGVACDGGPCRSCSIGTHQFPVGTGLSCDGCNECTCSGHGGWVTALVICDELPPIERCGEPAAEPSLTGLIYLDTTSAWSPIALRARFERGGCSPTEVRGCYALQADDPARISIWLEPMQPLAGCRSPFIAEQTYRLDSLRMELRQLRGSGFVALDIGGPRSEDSRQFEH